MTNLTLKLLLQSFTQEKIQKFTRRLGDLRRRLLTYVLIGMILKLTLNEYYIFKVIFQSCINKQLFTSIVAVLSLYEHNLHARFATAPAK